MRADIEKLALAQYFCELAGVLAPSEEPAEEFLRLLLTALHLLGAGKRDPRLIKAVTELRLLALAGYMPDLTACRACGGTDSPVMWLSLTAGNLTCDACPRPGGAVALPPNILAAMRHGLYRELEKAFSFTMQDASLTELSRAAEAFLLAQLQRGFRTLDFYHSLSNGA